MTEPRTATFAMSILPEYPGVYEVQTKNEKWIYSRWTGIEWRMTCAKASDAAQEFYRSKDCYNGYIVGWRGLAEKPE